MNIQYALPIIDGLENKYNTNFYFRDGIAKIDFIVGDRDSVDFLEKVTTPEIHTLHYKINKDGRKHLLLNRCHVYVTGISSTNEEPSEIELTVEKAKNLK